jgi:[acyl-carrier-protein] S-malonyltransferase
LDQPASLSREQLKKGIKKTAFAFRGYNVTNLGETPKLLRHKVFGPVIEKYLRRGSEICADVLQTPVDLVQRVRDEKEATLEEYHEALSLVVTVEQAHVEILKTFFDISLSDGDMMFGFSLGEISALVAGGVLRMDDALAIPLKMSRDAVELSHNVTLAVLFSRSAKLPYKNVQKICMEINAEGQGVIGVSAVLAPNSMLMIGQGNTLDRFAARRAEISPARVYLRRNDHQWPPLHTPIVWERNIPNRSQYMMHTMQGACRVSKPPVLSLVTGQFSYDEVNMRDIIGDWVDHPQLLWDAVDTTLARGNETVVHVGPQPNIIPATFERLANNVTLQTKGKFRMRTLSRIVEQRWLTGILPRRATLLRAPKLRHIILEEWLLQQKMP